MPPSRQIQPHANSVKNCKNAAEIIKFCAKKLAQDSNSYTLVYAPSAMPGDLSCYQGEIAFEIVDHGYPRTKDGQPMAMTSLNALAVRKKGNLEASRSELNKIIRILGPVYAETIFVPENPQFSQHPVIILSGVSTVRNTGPYTIEAGDIVLAVLPPLVRRPQIPEDVRTPISDTRRVLETIPLRQVKDPFTNEELVVMAKNLAFQAMVSDICQVAFLYAARMAASGAGGLLTPAQLNAVDTHVRDALNRPPPARGTPLVPSPHLPSQDALDDVVARISRLMYTPDAQGVAVPCALMKRLGTSSVNVAPYILSNVFAQMVGVATTTAAHDNMFDMISTPTPQALMGRFRIEPNN